MINVKNVYVAWQQRRDLQVDTPFEKLFPYMRKREQGKGQIYSDGSVRKWSK